MCFRYGDFRASGARQVQRFETAIVAAPVSGFVMSKRTGRKRSITSQLVRVCCVTSLQVKEAVDAVPDALRCQTARARSSAS